MKFKMQSLTEVWKESKLYLMGLVALFGIIFGSAFTYQNIIKPIASTVSVTTVRAEDETVELSYSMYDMSAWLSAYYNAATSPSGWKSLEYKTSNDDYNGKALLTQAAVRGASESDDTWSLATNTWIKDGKLGGGGALLGFPDKEVIDGGIIGFLSSKTSSSTTDYSFESLKTTNNGFNSLQAYAYYGASLQALGIDSSMGGGLMGWHPIRMFAGAVIWLAYIIVSFIEKIFALSVAILQVTNPFKWFATAMSYTWIVGDSGILAGLTSLISNTYKIFSNFGWVIMIPIIVSSLIFMMIFSGGGRQNPNLDQRRRSKFRYGVIYFLFLGVGVPFLGTAYTAGLDAMSATFGTGFGQNSFSADAVVLSTYVDNSSWIERHRMYLPDSANIVWDTGSRDVTSDSKASVKQTALAINALSYPAAKNAVNVTDATNWNFNDGSTDQVNNVVNVSNILWKYMIGETYDPGTWENNVKAYLLQQAESKDTISHSLALSAIELTSREGYKYLGYVNPNVTGTNHGGIIVEDDWFKFMFKDPDISIGSEVNLFLTKGYADNGDGGITITTPGGRNHLVLKSNASINNNGSAGFGTTNATMSYLEMYNYLNSKFTSNKVRVYSTNALASNYVRDSHAEVNQVGSGMIHKFLIWFNTGVMLFGLAILAVGYAFGMLIGAFRRYFDIISSIFMGTLGFQKAMIRATAGTIMLIVETLGTLVIYELVKTFYIGLPSLIESAFSLLSFNGLNITALPNFGFGTAVTKVVFIGIIFTLILSSFLLIWSTFMLLRIRKPIIDLMDITFTKIINKLFYGDGSVPDDAPKSVNPPDKSGGMVGDVAAVGAGLTAGALGSNIDGAEGNDGKDGWSDGGVANGDVSSESNLNNDGDGPDARVASSRDTEDVGSEIAGNGKLNRSFSDKAENIGDAISQASQDTNDDIADGVDSAKAVGNKMADAANPVGSMVGSGKGDSNSSDASSALDSISGSEQSPLEISDDDSVSISSATSTPSGGLTPDGMESSISAISSAKSSVEDNDTVEASNVVPLAKAAVGAVAQSENVGVGESGKVQTAQNMAQSQAHKQLSRQSTGATESAPSAQASAGEHAMAAKDHAVQAGAEAKASAENVTAGVGKISEGVSETTQGVGNATAGAGRVMAGDVSGAVQAGQGAVQTAQGVGKTIQGVQQTVKGVEQGVSAANHAMDSAGHAGSAATSVVGGQQIASAGGVGGQQVHTAGTVAGSSGAQSVQQMAQQAVGQTQQVDGAQASVGGGQSGQVGSVGGQQHIQTASAGGVGQQVQTVGSTIGSSGVQGAQQMVQQTVGQAHQAGGAQVAVGNGAVDVRSVGSQFVQKATNAALAGAGLSERQVSSSGGSNVGQGQGQRIQAQSSQPIQSRGQSSQLMAQAKQNLRQAGQMAQSSVRNASQGVTSMNAGLNRVMSGDIGGAKQVVSGAKQSTQGLRQAASAVGSVGRAGANVGQAGQQVVSKMANSAVTKATDTVNKAANVAQKVANSNVGRVVGGVAMTTSAMTKPLRNHIVDSTARTWAEAASPSGRLQQDANSNYYYDQYDSRKDNSRQTARSYEPRQTQQRERTDARIRRTRRPS